MIYTSNLVIGLEKGLDDPAFLKRAADETGTGVELFLHTHDTAYLRNMEKAAQWLGDRPRTTHGPFIGVEAASPKGSQEHEHFWQRTAMRFKWPGRCTVRIWCFIPIRG